MSSNSPAGSPSNQLTDVNSLHLSYTSTDSSGSRDIQESTITSEGKNNEKNSDERNEARKNIVIKEEWIQPPPHMLEPQTPTPGDFIVFKSFGELLYCLFIIVARRVRL